MAVVRVTRATQGWGRRRWEAHSLRHPVVTAREHGDRGTERKRSFPKWLETRFVASVSSSPVPRM